IIRARSTRLVGSVRDREISSKRFRCSASVRSAITRRGATTGSPNPIPHPLLTTSRPKEKIKPNILIYRNLYTSTALTSSLVRTVSCPLLAPPRLLRHCASNKKPRQGSMIGGSCCLGEGLELCRVAEPGELG